jgi:hypothetical protein
MAIMALRNCIANYTVSIQDLNSDHHQLLSSLFHPRPEQRSSSAAILIVPSKTLTAIIISCYPHGSIQDLNSDHHQLLSSLFHPRPEQRSSSAAILIVPSKT